ncbi:MAG: DUF4147 domain-containing protein [Phycisphaerales bacterium]|nr:DUF4147 domain-containing protein [Phycisphaerales bacterium]
MSPEPRKHIDQVLQAALAAADSARLVHAAIPSPPTDAEVWHVVAVGKASTPMLTAAIRAPGLAIDRGVHLLSIRPGEYVRLKQGRVRVWEVDHPIPTTRNLAAAAAVHEFVARIPPEDNLLCLLSGGASAHLCFPRPPLTLAHLADITDALLRAGAPIQELNAVRKHCEVLKGGGLAAAATARRIHTLILSDVLGDHLDVIGSGPTAPDPTTFGDALAVLERRALLDAVPAVTDHLRRGLAGEEPETAKPDAPFWSRVQNRVIGNNRLALDAACNQAHLLGYTVADRRDAVEGEAADRARQLAAAAIALQSSGTPPACIAWGGETTVTVGAAPGRGGRNQEFALAAALALEGHPGITLASFSTDGRDGPTDAAGAVIDSDTASRIRSTGIDPAAALAQHDSHTALDAAGALIRAPATDTNVNDLMLALVG